jgi:RND family efflux transporter MFP subunit
LKKFALFLLAVGIVGLTFYASSRFASKAEEEHGSGRPEELPLVDVQAVERRAMREVRNFPGSVIANESVSITPKITGLILKIHVELGDTVAVGDPLVTIDDAEYVKRLRQAEANLELARAMARRSETAFNLAVSEFERLSRAGAQGLVTDQALDSARASRESASADQAVALAEVSRAESLVEEAQLNIQNTRIVSPLQGRVQSRVSDPGELASSSSPILTIVNADPAEVVVYVPERDLILARVGRDAKLRVRGGDFDFDGNITRVSPGLRETSRTAEVIISVPNSDYRLWPGMSADVELLAREEPNALVIPSEAIIFQTEHAEVYVLDGNVARLVVVEVGIETGGYSQITAGLEEGDQVVVKGQFLLRDGQEVTWAGAQQGNETGGVARDTD